MRPIGGVESKVTAAAVRFSGKTDAELRAILKRGSGATKIERLAARRVVRARLHPFT